MVVPGNPGDGRVAGIAGGGGRNVGRPLAGRLTAIVAVRTGARYDAAVVVGRRGPDQGVVADIAG